VRILIADDHELIRQGVRGILRSRMDVDIAEASNGQEAIEQARKTNPDVIILDFMMSPGMTGIKVAQRLKKEMPQVPILLLSMHDLHAVTGELAQIGFQGFVSKSEAAQKLPEAIDTVLAGGTYFGPALPIRQS
jgi:DNA-binding NarL/FixJ family response regulator